MSGYIDIFDSEWFKCEVEEELVQYVDVEPIPVDNALIPIFESLLRTCPHEIFTQLVQTCHAFYYVYEDLDIYLNDVMVHLYGYLVSPTDMMRGDEEELRLRQVSIYEEDVFYSEEERHLYCADDFLNVKVEIISRLEDHEYDSFVGLRYSSDDFVEKVGDILLQHGMNAVEFVREVNLKKGYSGSYDNPLMMIAICCRGLSQALETEFLECFQYTCKSLVPVEKIHHLSYPKFISGSSEYISRTVTESNADTDEYNFIVSIFNADGQEPELMCVGDDMLLGYDEISQDDEDSNHIDQFIRYYDDYDCSLDSDEDNSYSDYFHREIDGVD